MIINTLFVSYLMHFFCINVYLKIYDDLLLTANGGLLGLVDDSFVRNLVQFKFRLRISSIPLNRQCHCCIEFNLSSSEHHVSR